MKTQHQTQHQQPSKPNQIKITFSCSTISLSTEKAQQIHAKPDVALALLSVEKDPINLVDEVSYEREDKSHLGSPTNIDGSKNSAIISSTETIHASPAAEDIPSPATTSP
mmetsp:Transcript_27923/g.48277  ORF Transcript_27923/g.48277 Transcript_27923/m.48277 type:complete len:110 (+) Transcript_27923:489-818(+)